MYHSFRLVRSSALCLAALCVACTRAPQTAPTPPPDTPPRPYFYTDLPYGSESAFNPFSNFLNDAFDVFQLEDKRLDRQTFGASTRIMFHTLAHPIETIRQYGPGETLRNELLPLTWNGNGGGAWTANYSGHLIGGGMVSRRLREWYAANGVPHPELAADVTHFISHFANEVNETKNLPYLREEGLIDLMVFDPLGVLAFHFDGVAALFSNSHVQLSNWPGQATIAPQNFTMDNTGQTYVAKVYPRSDAHWAAFAYVGLSAQAGITYGRPDALALSVGVGGRTTSLPYEVSHPDKQFATVEPQAGVFIDRRNSLLASFLWNAGKSDRSVLLNVYPGAIAQLGYMPRFWMRVEEGGTITGGIGTQLGLGLGALRVH